MSVIVIVGVDSAAISFSDCVDDGGGSLCTPLFMSAYTMSSRRGGGVVGVGCDSATISFNDCIDDGGGGRKGAWNQTAENTLLLLDVHREV